MRIRKRNCIIASVGVMVILSVLFYCIDSYHGDVQEKPRDVIQNLSTSQEDKEILEQKYIIDKIEETLSKYEFESDEEKNLYREILVEQFQG